MILCLMVLIYGVGCIVFVRRFRRGADRPNRVSSTVEDSDHNSRWCQKTALFTKMSHLTSYGKNTWVNGQATPKLNASDGEIRC